MSEKRRKSSIKWEKRKKKGTLMNRNEHTNTVIIIVEWIDNSKFISNVGSMWSPHLWVDHRKISEFAFAPHSLMTRTLRWQLNHEFLLITAVSSYSFNNEFVSNFQKTMFKRIPERSSILNVLYGSFSYLMFVHWEITFLTILY